MRQHHQHTAEAMDTYPKQLRVRRIVADSVVRKCLLLSKEEYVLEQTISIEVGAIGEPQSGSTMGEISRKAFNGGAGTRAWETHCFPVIVHNAGDDSRSRPA